MTKLSLPKNRWPQILSPFQADRIVTQYYEKLDFPMTYRVRYARFKFEEDPRQHPVICHRRAELIVAQIILMMSNFCMSVTV